MNKTTQIIGILAISSFVNAQTNQIGNSGNVGIGTTNPSKKLDVQGQTRLNGSVQMDSVVIIKDSIIVDRDAHVKENAKIDGKLIVLGKSRFQERAKFNAKAVFNENSIFNNKVVMNALSIPGPNSSVFSDGNIILQNPDGRLFKTPIGSMKRLMYVPESQCLQDANGNSILFTPTWHNEDPHTLYTGVGNCERKAIVGINTSNPTGALHIINETSLANNVMVLERDNNLISPQELIRVNNNGHLHINAYQNPNDPNDNSYLMITDVASGKKFLQLDKTGLLRAREIKVDPHVWPDYVFEKDYKLMPLSDVEEFIKENGHLPNVKSAQTIEEEGLNLGETNKMLMEKIEEMTLYMIDLEKKVNVLEEKLNEKNK